MLNLNRVTKICLLGCLLMCNMGCGVGGESKNGSSGGSINKDTVSLNSADLIDYIYNNKKAVLNASDCTKFSAQDWQNIIHDSRYSIAPADPISQSMYACKGAMLIVQNTNYSLERATREDIKNGFLNGIVEEFDYTASSQPKREYLTMAKCESKYGDLNGVEWAKETTKGENIPEAIACHQAFFGSNAQATIDAYNNGSYDGLQGIENFSEPDTDNSYNQNPSNQYIPEQDREQEDIDDINSMTWSECNNKYGHYTDQQLLDYGLNIWENGVNINMKANDRLDYEMLFKEIVHCRNILFGS